MADVKWIKIVTDIFDNRKIRQIEIMPEGDSILVIWFKLICLAGRINDNGAIYLTPDIPYTEDMLAAQFNRPLNTIKLALNVFTRFGMIEIVDDFLRLPSWEKYQSVDKLERMKAGNRERQARFRERKRDCLPGGDNGGEQNVTLPVTLQVTPCNATDRDREEDRERDRDIEEDREGEGSPAATPPASPRQTIDYDAIKNLYNSICKSLPQCKVLSDARRKAIKARLASGYTVDDLRRLFELAESSSFLRGKNDRNWHADFDWLLKDANMAKVFDGKYDDRKGDNYGTNQPGSGQTRKYGTYL